MNNWIGLLIALSLALVAGVLNWKYLERKSEEIEMVSFVAIKEGVRIKPGDTFLEKHFAPLDVPRKSVGYLTESAVLYSDRFTIVSMKALRDYVGGDVLLRQELKTPPEEFTLGKDELAIWIPVDGSSFVSSLVEPGDMVSFFVTSPAPAVDTHGPPGPVQDEDPEWNLEGNLRPKPPERIAYGESELIGPFRVLSLGGRLGSYEVSRASGASSAQENVMGIAVRQVGNGVEPKAEKLLQRVNSASFRQAGVLLHPRTKK
jgi:hypothetical protein